MNHGTFGMINWRERGDDHFSITVGTEVEFLGVTGKVVEKTKAPVTTTRGRDYEVTARYWGSAVMFPGDAVPQWISDADLSVVR